MIIKKNEYYPVYKRYCYSQSIVTQGISIKAAKKCNLTIASNILRQINSKLGGDLFILEQPKEIFENTMLLGIDVCH